MGRRLFFVSLLMLVYSALFCFPFHEQAYGTDEVDAQTKDTESPLSLAIQPAKEQFRLGEGIMFDIVLTNNSRQALQVKRLGEHSLDCLIDGQPWGGLEPVREKPVVLYPEKSLRKRLKVAAYSKKGEIEISCSYNIGFKGVRPSDTKKIKIIK